MKFLTEIKKDTLLIVPSSLKRKVLYAIDKLDKILPIKIMSLEEVKKHLCFDYDERALLYLMDTYHYEYDVALKMLENMYYVEEQKYDLEKLNQLVSLRNELKEKKLLLEDDFFSSSLLKKEIIIYGYDFVDSFSLKLLKPYSVQVVSKFEKRKESFVVYEFGDIEAEVEYVFKKILTLIHQGVECSNIKIVNANSDYYYVMRKLAMFYPLTVEIPAESSIFTTSIVQDFLNYLKETKSFQESLCFIKENYSTSKKENISIYQQLLKIVNRYVDLDFSWDSIYQCFVEDLKKTKVSLEHQQNVISLTSLYDNYFDENDIVFVVGFNQNIIPSLTKDEDYISDDWKKRLGLETSDEINKMEKKRVSEVLSSLTNVIITYKLKTIDNDFYPSNLIKDLNMNVLHDEIKISYSKIHDKVKLASYYDDLLKYGTKSANLSLFHKIYQIPYLTYDNTFKGVSSDKIRNKLEKLVLSYSTMDNFYRCGFRYYIASVLKLDKFESSFKTVVGNLFHYLLSRCFEDNFDLEVEYDNYLKEYIFTPGEAFLIKKLKRELAYIIKKVKELHKMTYLDRRLLEQKIYIDKSKDIPVTFMGIIDKIMYRESTFGTYVAIVDYKTGNPNINLFHSIYGIDMQLAIYLYLIKKSNLVANPIFVGLYLQKILNTEITYSSTKSYLKQKDEHLKLTGYSSSDKERLEKFDVTYENSEYIRGMKVSKNGFYAYAKVLEDEAFNSLIQLVDNKVDEAIDGILNGKFAINPKKVGNENVGCLFCKFQDLCYRREKDFVSLKEYKDLSFLGGDIDA